MKKILLLFSILYTAVAFSQILGNYSSYGTPTQYTPRNQELEYELLEENEKTNEQIESIMEANRKYRDALIDWIFKLKSKVNEKEFLSAMEYNYNLLRNMNDENLGRNRLDEIKLNINDEIDKYNTRQKELPQKLYDAGNDDLKNKNYLDAINNYSNLIRINPDFIGTYRNRGYAYQVTGKYSLAIADLNKYIEKKDDDPFAYSARGWAKSSQKDYMGALSDFNKQIELDPSAESYFNRGSAKSELGDEYGAIADYSKSIELKPDFSMAYNNRGWSNFKLKKYKEALVDFNKAIMIDNTNWNAFDSRQETKFALNDLKGCIEDCNSAIELNPKCSNSFFIRGRAFYKQGNKQKACEDWSKAGELGKAEAYDFILKYCNEQNNSTKTNTKTNPNNCTHYLYIAHLQINTSPEYMFLFSTKTYSDKSKIVVALPENALLNVIEKPIGDDIFYLVCYNGTQGYISKYILK